MYRSFFLKCIFSIITFYFGGQVVSAQPAPNEIKIQSIITNGSGCIQNSVSATISPDLSSFSLLFDSYSAESQGNFQVDRKNCDVRILLSIPNDWAYSIVSADYRGYAYADLGTELSQQATYSFDGSRPINERPGFENVPGRHSFKNTKFVGPVEQNFFIRDEINPSVAPWSSCTRNQTQTLFISTYLTAHTKTNLAQSKGFISLDTVDGEVSYQSFGLRWRKCNSSIINPPNNPNRPNPPRPPGPRPRPPRF